MGRHPQERPQGQPPQEQPQDNQNPEPSVVEPLKPETVEKVADHEQAPVLQEQPLPDQKIEQPPTLSEAIMKDIEAEKLIQEEEKIVENLPDLALKPQETVEELPPIVEKVQEPVAEIATPQDLQPEPEIPTPLDQENIFKLTDEENVVKEVKSNKFRLRTFSGIPRACLNHDSRENSRKIDACGTYYKKRQ